MGKFNRTTNWFKDGEDKYIIDKRPRCICLHRLTQIQSGFDAYNHFLEKSKRHDQEKRQLAAEQKLKEDIKERRKAEANKCLTETSKILQQEGDRDLSQRLEVFQHWFSDNANGESTVEEEMKRYAYFTDKDQEKILLIH